MLAVGDVCQEAGRHGVIFGERGVGKTSLAWVSAEIQKISGLIPIRVACDSTDDFETIWAKFFDELLLHSKATSNKLLTSVVEVALGFIQPSGAVAPDHVRKALHVIAEMVGLLAVFDEYDRIEEEETSRLMSDLIKMLSDQLLGVTILVVGVAEDVETLVANHQSIQRCLTQIRMPRMNKAEIAQIIDEGYEHVGISIDAHVREWLIDVPQGLPSYAHFLARAAARNAVLEGRDLVGEDDFFFAVTEAVKNIDQTISTTYQAAIASPQVTIYEDVIIACALANQDSYGFFTPAAVREPLSHIRRERYEIQRYRTHLEKLCERGPVLERRGKLHNWRYRFRDPMMQTYAILKGLQLKKFGPSTVPEPPSLQSPGAAQGHP